MLSCSHSLCSSCFTASLNIVGEKEFSCVLCSEPVLDFRFLSSKSPAVGDIGSANGSPEISGPPLPSHTTFLDPVLQSSSSELSVLRLDDVPWDVTPFMLSSWADIPALQAHVLLDCDGKTLSHAYIEASAQVSRKILLNCRNKVLGSGKRARRVTITASSQDELMQQLFPSWGGTFEDASPTLSNVPASQVSSVMNTGLLSTCDVDGMKKLIFQPDSRYVKDPSLPFHALISVINKFPSGGDSRVFWNYVIRDSLFNLVYSATAFLVSSDHVDWKNETIAGLITAFLKCSSQVHGLLDKEQSSLDSSVISTPPSNSFEPAPTVYIPQNHHVDGWSPYNTIALEFGLEPHVVQAVYERLSQSSFI
ncbi:hypothetical protein BS47DRAFT_748955 [Hydnum rufescens UP504]|uniref:RING-type domain-containing protein n=1 Tax=Hydnum rufescens UP504 TaxID=1448309 RepID=A0A9P6BA65_9AGAM|nr:hypothetical protein BS47DRAFT_748955 [Hydnum rufescens UP504]